MKPDAKCSNCGRDFADHNYLANSIDGWQCPDPYYEMGYGYFTSGDPRHFFPDAESCSPAELANHRKACDEWDRGLKTEYRGGCGSHTPFGIGMYRVEFESTFEEADVPEWEREPWELS